MPRVYHAEVHAQDAEKIARFYQEVFGWIVAKKQAGTEDYWFMHTGSGGSGIHAGLKHASGTHSGWVPQMDVDDLDAFCAKIEKAGGKVVQPKRTIPGTGYLAYCTDPEGHLFGVLQKDPSVE